MIDILDLQGIVKFIRIQCPPAFLADQGSAPAFEILANPVLVPPPVDLQADEVTRQVIQSPDTFFPVIAEFALFLITGFSPKFVVVIDPAPLFTVLFVHAVQGIPVGANLIYLALGKAL
jgi:hypothetical protein